MINAASLWSRHTLSSVVEKRDRLPNGQKVADPINVGDAGIITIIIL